MGWEVAEWPWGYTTATDLSIRLRHHVFDTRYRATALRHEGGRPVTADETYFEKAHAEGGIVPLEELSRPC